MLMGTGCTVAKGALTILAALASLAQRNESEEEPTYSVQVSTPAAKN